MSWNIG